MKHTFLRHLCTCLALVCIGALAAVSASAQTGVASFTDGTAYLIYNGGSDNGASSAPYLYDDSGTLKGQTLKVSTAQQWIVNAVSGKTGYYTVQNASTKRYLKGLSSNSDQGVTSETSCEVYLKANTNTGTDGSWWNIYLNESSTASYNYYGSSKIGGWAANNGNSSGLSNSEWKFVAVSSLLADGEAVPEAGETVYRIVSNTSSSLAVYETDGSLSLIDYTNSDNDNSFGQYWKLVSQTDGTVALQNLLTGNYVQTATKNATYKTGTSAHGFTIQQNSHVTDAYKFDIRDTETLGFNCASSRVCSWTFYDGSSDANSLWKFRPVTLTEAQQTALATAQAAYKKDAALKATLANGKVRIKTRRSNGYYITQTSATSSNLLLQAAKDATSDDYYRQVWIIESADNGKYTLRNLKTGNYLSYNTASTSAKDFYIAYNADNTDAETYVNIYENIASTSGAIHYQTWGDIVVSWGATAGEGSDWEFENVDITDDAVRVAFDELSGIRSTLPTEATYVKLTNIYTGGCITDNQSKNVTVDDERTKDASQVWKLIPVDGSEGYFQLQNAQTLQYIGYAGWNSQVASQTDEASSTSGNGYLVQRVTASRFESHFTFVDPAYSARALHSSNGKLITWSPSASASMWRICPSDMTDDEIAAAQTSYTNLQNELAKKDTYSTAFAAFFTDAACTTLADSYKSMTDDQLKGALTSAGVDSETLQATALKVKNDSWAKWEKTFRIRSVDPYSDAGTWNNLLKIGNEYTSLSNPTGIWANAGEVHYIFVGDDVPEGATFTVRSVSKTDSQGSQVATLTKGLNVFTVSKAGALYLVYTVTTSLDDDSKKLADYPSIPVHIEGGTVDGYFDATREGINTDDDWKEMVSDGLFSKSFVMMKGRHLIYQLNGELTKQYIPEKMREIVDFWDWMMDVFHEKMAINDYYDRWNNVNGFYSVTYNYMFATTYGTYYNESTLGEVLDYDKMAAGGGSLWGPAHENGHNHQSMINMIGCTEISNNLFSQIIVHLNGKTSTRLNGRKFSDIASLYAAGTSWHDYNLWDRNTLYLKLYLYYEVAGYKPDFCRALFKALRQDPLNHSTGSESSPVPASEDFLKFALKCCEVTGDDLSEFFQAYGFFVPFETRVIGDYANYYTNNTQEMIDAALEKMHSYAKPKGNILFIENHIKHEPAIDHDGNYLYNSDGTQVLRTDYSDEDAVGKCGDVGSYSDYAAGNYADGYTYNLSDNTVTMTGNGGAVGYKVYDSEGNLLYFSNLNTFTLPESVVEKLDGDLSTMVVKAAQPDGTDVALPNPASTVYTLKVYHADALSADKSNTVYTDGTSATLPALEGNALAFIQPTTAATSLPETLTQAQNVVDATDESNPTAYSIVLTDKADYYAPAAFTAQTLTYERANTEGWNSVCLPFAVTADDFGTGARLETLTALTETDGTVTLHFEAPSAAPEAGTPCLVYCPEGTDSWTLVKTNATLAAKAQSTAIDGYSLNGSFENAAIGAGHYKLNAAGTAMGVTTAAGRVTAFRCYVSPLAGTSSSVRSLAIEHGSGTVSAIGEAAVNASSAPAVYNLTGRKVAKPAKGGLYIVNGKKVIMK